MTDDSQVDTSSAADPLVLSIDVGSSSARALVYDARGRMVSGFEAHRPYLASTTPDGGVVIDADTLMGLVCECLDDVVRAARASSRTLAAVASDTFWHSMMGVDGHGKAVTPIYTWADTRSASVIPQLRERLDEEAVHSRTGAILHSNYWPAKLLWLSQTAPELMNKATWWMSFGEYLYLRLFGERRVSISMASGTGLFDQNTCSWDAELLTKLPIREEQLSPIHEFSDALSGLHQPFSGRWPTLNDRPWYLAFGDGACNNVGSGGFCQDWAVLMIGTSGALRVVREADHVSTPRGLWTYRVDRRRIVQGGALSGGGNVFAWLERTLQLDPIPQLEDELAAMPPDGHGLTVLPFLAGERSPDWNPDARAAILGIRLATRPLDIARASVEAVAYRFGIVFDVLKASIGVPKGIIGSGAGLVHSPAWLQIMADVLGESILVSAAPEATSRGAALLALESMGVLKALGDAPAPLGKEYTPDPVRSEVYRAATSRQERFYHLLMASGADSLDKHW